VTAERRLATVEATLTPLQRILAWLDEAHAFGSLDAYVDFLLDQPAEAFPINRLAKGAAESARKEAGRAPATVVDAAVRTALRAAVFRFELVMRINVVAYEMIDKEVLIYAALAGQIAMLVSDDRAERLKDPVYLRRLGQCRDVTMMRVDELLAEEEARSTAEARYLGDHPALFPNGIDKWAEQLQLSQEQAVTTDRIAELDGMPPAATSDPDVFARRVAERVADLIEPARTSALDKLDEGRQAHRVATAWLRSKRLSLPLQTDPEVSPLDVTR
jgi:hypothetical protein